MDVVDLSAWSALILLGAIVVVYLLWAYAVARGVRFRPVLAGAITAFYLAFFFFLETATTLGPPSLVALNLLLVVIAGGAAFAATVRTTRVLRDPAGRLLYRGSPGIVLTWLVLLLLEIYVQQLLLGYVAILHLVVIRGVPLPVSPGAISVDRPRRVALALVDALFAIGTGLAVGSNVAMYLVFAHARWSRPHRAAS